jgi:putative ABC transport system substrate-binding protein
MGQVRRRQFLIALSALLVAPIVEAQRRDSPVRIGWIAVGTPTSRTSLFFDAVKLGLRELGYFEGRNLVIEARWADGTLEQVAELTADLMRARVEIIIAQGQTIHKVKEVVGGRIPIVFGFSGDPVEAGFVASLSRPGGNLSGVSYMTFELVGKRIELLREVLPGVSRVAILANPLHPGESRELGSSQAAARQLGIALQYLPVRSGKDVEAAFEAMTRERAEAITAFPDALIMLQRKAIADYSMQRRIPAVSGWADFARDGNLMTYGPNLSDSWRRVASYVDKILKGAKPSNLPVEQPTKFELVINMKTARAIGLTVPQSVLLRADELIQ